MMTKHKLTIVRGLPGSGKSTYARSTFDMHVEADFFFQNINNSGDYNFKASLLPVAHQKCYADTVFLLNQGYDVIVANTFTTVWEMEKYFKITELIDDVVIEIVEMTGNYGSIHNVPKEVLVKMKERWEDVPKEWNVKVTKC